VTQGSDPLNRPALERRASAGLAPRLTLSGAIAMSLFVGAPTSGAAGPLPDMARFQFERQAQNHCPGQAIVWVDPRSQTYNASADRFYGRTKTGAFVCLREAENAGYRAKRRP